MARSLPLLAVFFLTTSPRLAADPGVEFFEKKVRPVLASRCYQCHSADEKQRGGLVLDSGPAILAGGDSGPVVVPGKPAESLLIRAVRYGDAHLKMPPTGKLSDPVLADLEAWVEMGAPVPADEPATVVNRGGIDIEAGRQYWSFRPVADHPIPDAVAVAGPDGWANGPIDRFILARLADNGMSPVADADPATLLRRMTIDLTGLPPLPEKIEEFLADESPDALDKVADRLLASAAFGERWGRHWLDLARFAESTGGGRSMLLPNAWRYRDYVIRSFNQDKPFDMFVREQIAGDLMPTGADLGERRDRLVATAYLALGPTNYERQDKDILEMDVIDEQLETIGRSLLGMTIGCARCHDHKFDPIPTADYYAMAGVLKSTRTLIHGNVSNWVEKPLPLPAEEQKRFDAHDAAVKAMQAEIDGLKAALKKGGGAAGPVAVAALPGVVVDDAEAEPTGEWTHSTYSNSFVGSGYLHDGGAGKGQKSLAFRAELPAGEYEVRLAYVTGGNRAVKVPVHVSHAAGETTVLVDQSKPPPIGGRFVSLGDFPFDPARPAVVTVSNEGTSGHVIADAVQFLTRQQAAASKVPEKAEELAGRVTELEADLKKLKASGPQRPVTMCVTEHNVVADCPLCIRGNFHNQGPAVSRGFLQVATVGEAPAIPEKSSGRLQMAEWLTSPDNPLTSRIYVNRIWHHLFGTGIVRTVDNFGTTGETPSHPELLDHMAAKFLRGGWSTKDMVRELVLTRTYGLASEARDPRDPENRLLSRANHRRMDAESIRDSMLLAAGLLDRAVGGPILRPGQDEYGYRFQDSRRSVYTPVLRNRLHELFEAFDFPDPNLPNGRRNVSTVATQALFMLNNPMVLEWAGAAAKRSLAVEGDEARRVELAYRRTLGREPTSTERELALGFLAKAKTDAEREAAWARLHQTLFACIDFRYVR